MPAERTGFSSFLQENVTLNELKSSGNARVPLTHRRRMKLEDQAKVVASVWGAEFVKFLAALAVLPWSIWKKRSNSSYFSNSTEAKQLARQATEQILSPKQTWRPLPCLLILSFFYALTRRVHCYIQIQAVCSLWDISWDYLF